MERRTLAAAILVSISSIASTRDAAAAPVAAPNAQVFPKIAAGAGGFFAVWEDSRNGAAADIYGTRLSETGAILDAAGIAVSTEVATEERADVAFSAGVYVVVWQSGDTGDRDIWGRTVATNSVLGAPFLIAGGPGDQGTPTIACGTSRCVVAYVDNASGSYDVLARAVTPAGAAGTAVDVSQVAGGEFGPVIVARGDEYYVAWQDERLGPAINAFGARLVDGGVLSVDGVPVILSAGPTDRPTGIASDGTSVLVAWTRGADYPMSLFARRVPWTGLPTTEPEIELAASGDNSDRSGAAFDGANFLVTWQDLNTGEVVGRRIGPGGTLVESSPVRLSDGASQPDFNTALAFASGRYCLVWDDLRLGPTGDIFGTSFNASLVRGSPADAVVSTVFGNSVPALPPFSNLAALVALGAAGVTVLRRRR